MPRSTNDNCVFAQRVLRPASLFRRYASKAIFIDLSYRDRAGSFRSATMGHLLCPYNIAICRDSMHMAA